MGGSQIIEAGASLMGDTKIIFCDYHIAYVDFEWICPACPYRKGCEDYEGRKRKG